MSCITSVPVDILLDILSRLPVKFLLACKCVCKLWNKIIATDTSLIKLHLQRSKQAHHQHVLPTIKLLHQSVLGTTYSTSLSSVNDQLQRQTALNHLLEINFFCPHSLCFRLLGSYNGLLCFYGVQHFETKSSAILLSNPATKQYHILPESLVDDSWHEVALGFGFQEVGDDYKVVKITYLHNQHWSASAVEVYSLKRGSWNCIGDDVVLLKNLDMRMAMEANHVFVHGHAHWLTTTKGSAKNKKRMYKLLSFDMEDEVFRVIAVPNSFECDKSKRAYIGLFEGCVTMFMDMPSLRCEIWVMREYGVVESWELMHDFMWPCHKPLGFNRRGELILRNSGQKGHDHEGNSSSTVVYCYNPGLRKLSSFFSVVNLMASAQVFSYTESLVSVAPDRAEPSEILNWATGFQNFEGSQKTRSYHC